MSGHRPRAARTGTAPAVLRVPPDAWYVPVARAVATEVAAAAGLSGRQLADVGVATTELATVLCTAHAPGACAELTLSASPAGMRIVGRCRTGQVEPPPASTSTMRRLHRVAHGVNAVCVVDPPGHRTLRLTATISVP